MRTKPPFNLAELLRKFILIKQALKYALNQTDRLEDEAERQKRF